MVEYRETSSSDWLIIYIEAPELVRLTVDLCPGNQTLPLIPALQKLLYVLKRVFRLHSIYRLFYKHKAANSSEPWLLDHTDARDRMQSDMHATLHPHWLQ